MRYPIKYIIRHFSLWLNEITRKWVVPRATWIKLDNGDLSAQIDLSDIAVKWGNLDPEFVRATLFLHRIKSLNARKKVKITS